MPRVVPDWRRIRPSSESVKRPAFHAFAWNFSGPSESDTATAATMHAAAPQAATSGPVTAPRTCSTRQPSIVSTDVIASASIASSHGVLRSVPLPRPCTVAVPQTAKFR